MKYVYPAIVTKAAAGGYLVEFPDLPNCFTDGDTLCEALMMAEDALSLYLYDLEDSHRPIPKPGNYSSRDVTLIPCDTNHYWSVFHGNCVKKTLTIPEWLNERGIEAGVNFSHLLQKALREELGV